MERVGSHEPWVMYDETRISHVHTRTEGWIEVLKVRAEGERVSRGQHLFDLYSPAMINAQEEYIQALDRGSQGLIRAGRQKLSALGISSGQIEEIEKTRKARQYILCAAVGCVVPMCVRACISIRQRKS